MSIISKVINNIIENLTEMALKISLSILSWMKKTVTPEPQEGTGPIFHPIKIQNGR